jgi:hypothetical protein
MFVGDKGVLQCHGEGGAPRLFPEVLRNATKPASTLKRSRGHHRDWIDACKGGEPASSNFSYGAHLTEIALLGVLALRSGHPIDWDATRMAARGAAGTDAMIHGSYRAGWEISSV